MRPTLILLSLVIALVSTTFAAQRGPVKERRNAIDPEKAAAQAVRRRQYIHPGTQKRNALYAGADGSEKEKRTFWWWFHNGGPDDHKPHPPAPTPPSSQTSMVPPKPCKQGKWQTCGPSVSCYNGWTIASYKHNNDDSKCCSAGLTCKTFGPYGQGKCVKEKDYDWCSSQIKDKKLKTQQQIEDFFQNLFNAGH